MALKDITPQSLAPEKLVDKRTLDAIELFVSSELKKPRGKNIRAISVSTENLTKAEGLKEDDIVSLKKLSQEVLRDLIEHTINTEMGAQGFKAKTSHPNDASGCVTGYTIHISW